MFKDRTRKRPKEQEYEVAKDLGGKRVPFSGSMKHHPGDAESGRFLVDAKTTTDSYGLNTKTLAKIHVEATSKGKLPLLQVELRNARFAKKWCVVEWDVFLDLLEQAGYNVPKQEPEKADDPNVTRTPLHPRPVRTGLGARLDRGRGAPGKAHRQ